MKRRIRKWQRAGTAVVLALAAAAAAPSRSRAAETAPRHTFAIGANDFLLDGRRLQIRCGEIHAPRVPPEYWRHRLQMCGEFYPGWFDTWGAPHHLGQSGSYLRDLEYMLKAGASFSIYMAHGGTTFGFWTGADRPFKPDTSSYDYDAPISEAGWPTEKFFKTRALFARYLLPGETLPPPPARNPLITIAPVEAAAPGDCFLDMRPWGKGYAWVNGHNLGRYWNIGPQQTMYVPGPWLRAGANEIVILDLLGPEKPVVAALAAPILDQLRPELDFARSGRRGPLREVDAPQPAAAGSFAPGTALQEIRFAAPATGRYFALESRSAHDGKPYAAVAELALLGADGQPLGAAGWTVAGVDSEETEREDGSAGNALDGQTASFWHTQWGGGSPGHPHLLVLDLGRTETLGGFLYTPRQGDAGVGGRIKDYRVFVGDRLRPRLAPAPQPALRVDGPATMAAGRVYLLRVEAQPDAGRPWAPADPDGFKVTVGGAGRLVPDPALKPMNPFTVEVPADATGAVHLAIEATNGAALRRVFAPGPPPPAQAFAARIDPARAMHRFAGLGGGALFYDNQFDITATPELYDWCFTDVKASFLHLLIRPDCEPANDNGDWRAPDPARFDFASAARPLRIAREALKRNPALTVYASLYTPPAWMKSPHSTRGDGTLQEGAAYRRELAEYVFAWLRHAQAQGVPVRHLAFFNEPDWPHTQDGMHFGDLGALADTFADCAAALDELIAADGTLRTKPLLVFPDALGPGSITRGGKGTEALKVRAGRLARVDVWGVHDYWNTGGDYWANRYRELRAFPGVGGKPIWMTEWAQRERHGDLDSALEYGRNILNALRSGAEAWMVFEWCHPYGNQSGLISTDWGEQTGERRFWRSKAYHVFRQIANTTPAGAQVVAMEPQGGTAGLEYLALKDGDRLIVHLMNSAPVEVRCELELAGAAAGPVVGWCTSSQADVARMPPPGFAVHDAGGRTLLSGTVPPYALVTLVR